MPTVLMRDVLWRASTLLEDVAPQFYRNTEHDMVDAANDAQTAICMYFPQACSRIDAVRQVPGTKQSIHAIPAAYCKPGDGSTPTVPIVGTQLLGTVRNMGADGLTPGAVVRRVAASALDAQDRNWHASAGTAIKAVVFDPATPRHYWIYPGAHASTQVWLDMAYTAQPLKIPNTGTAGAELYAYAGASTQTITIADEHLSDIVHYIVARMLYKPSEWADAQKGDRFTALFTGSLNAKVKALTGHDPNIKHLPMTSRIMGAAP